MINGSPILKYAQLYNTLSRSLINDCELTAVRSRIALISTNKR
jgi:hypothetical protein